MTEPPFGAPDAATPLADLLDFRDQAAVVTGGGAGIGEAICRRLHGAGASVVVVDVNPDARAVATALPRSRVVIGDVRERVTATEALEVASGEFGNVQLLVNCAGIYPRVPILDLTGEQWDDILDVNLKGTFVFCQVFAEAMARSGGGAIVNVASRAGIRPRPGQVAYSAAKAGVVSLTQGLAMELAPHGIRVNAVAPGPVSTQRAQVAADRVVAGTNQRAKDWQDDYRRRIPLGRFAQPDEIALAVTFLASRAASYITGAVLPVDGGAVLP